MDEASRVEQKPEPGRHQSFGSEAAALGWRRWLPGIETARQYRLAWLPRDLGGRSRVVGDAGSSGYRLCGSFRGAGHLRSLCHHHPAARPRFGRPQQDPGSSRLLKNSQVWRFSVLARGGSGQTMAMQTIGRGGRRQFRCVRWLRGHAHAGATSSFGIRIRL
jgi:hypothetical protein